MRKVVVSIGGKHNARVTKTARVNFAAFCESMLKNVPRTADKASAGWVCGAEFDPPYRDSENFVARHLLSLDYDHITSEDFGRLLDHFRGNARLVYTTWSHMDSKPRLRVWLPLSRPCGYDEFQAVSRAIAAAAPGGIELAARESHVPAQYMFRPAVKPEAQIQSWVDTESPWVDVDEVLGSYDDWTDRKSWPHRSDGDGVHSEGTSVDPRTKPGVIGAFCRAFTISGAIEEFGLPYAQSSPGRYTYTAGSRPDGCIVYDDDSKLHSHHDTDPARGQTNSYDLVRLHHFGWLDDSGGVGALADRPSSKAMQAFALEKDSVRAELVADAGFEDLDATDTSWLDDDDGAGEREGAEKQPGTAAVLPDRIVQPNSKLTDQENARRIQKKFGEKLIAIGGTFYHWEGTHWKKDDDRGFRYSTRLSKLVASEAETLKEKLTEQSGGKLSDEDAGRLAAYFKWANDCAQASKLTACEKILRKLLHFDAKGLNQAKHLLSCLSGTIDLRDGSVREHRSSDFITACAPTEYNPLACAPRFQQFLLDIFQGDATIVDFLQRWFGYCVTGSVDEHAMVFHIGEGGNGKGVLMRTLQAVLGSGYYGTANQNLLIYDSKGASPELAALLGKRMVTISETEPDLELRQGLLKAITGGDTLTARDLFEKYFEFVPTHKLQIFSNHEPLIKTQDYAMWRRILMVKYPVKYGTKEQVAAGDAMLLRDPDLEESLIREAPGILKWLIDGARAWYSHGLSPPESVLKATREYRADQDLPGKFASERICVDPKAWTALTGTTWSVYPAYKSWCDSMGVRPLGRVRFVRELHRVVKSAKAESRLVDGSTVPGFTGFRLTSEPMAE